MDAASQSGGLGATGLLGAAHMHSWMRAALSTAQYTRQLVDALNLFPVPDSDTGTNVTLTLTSACQTLDQLPSGADALMATRAAADGALRGARGNSGLLVSQALAALADVAAESPTPRGLRPVDLVHAYERIATTTWDAVSRPVTGTLLTVAADAARAARTALDEASIHHQVTVSDIAAAAALGAQESVVETAGLGHGPVDAGGAAFMLLLTTLSDVLAVQNAEDATSQPEEVMSFGALTPVAHQMLRELASGGVSHSAFINQATGIDVPGESNGEFEVMYLLEATAAGAQELRHQLESIGDSVGVVGAPDALGVGLYQVHVHTDTPRAALPRSGRARQICIHHLHPTVRALAGGWDTAEAPLPYLAPAHGGSNVVSFERLAARRRDDAAHSPSSIPAPGQEHQVGVIACTRAPGLIEQLARTGAVVVLHPQPEGIQRAVGDLGLSRVLVLPCDADAAAAAHEAARTLTARAMASDVRLPSRPTHDDVRQTPGAAGSGQRALPQLLVADTADEAQVVAAAVGVAGSAGEDLTTIAAKAGRAGAAMRTLTFSGVDAESENVALQLASMLRPDDSLVTIIVGRDGLPDVGAVAGAAVAQRSEELLGDPDAIELVVHAGGQSSPDILVALE